MGKSIVNAHSFKMDRWPASARCSAGFLLDSAFRRLPERLPPPTPPLLPSSLPSTTTTGSCVHQLARLVLVIVEGRPPSARPHPLLSLPHSSHMCFFFHLLLLRSPRLTPLSASLSQRTADYLAFIQNVIKENDQLPQYLLSFLPPILLLLPSLLASLSVFHLTPCGMFSKSAELREGREKYGRRGIEKQQQVKQHKANKLEVVPGCVRLPVSEGFLRPRRPRSPSCLDFGPSGP